MRAQCVPSSGTLVWYEHYYTKTGIFRRKTVSGYWCGTHNNPHKTKVIRTETVNEK